MHQFYVENKHFCIFCSFECNGAGLHATASKVQPNVREELVYMQNLNLIYKRR
jgi:hypothetical protein